MLQRVLASSRRLRPSQHRDLRSRAGRKAIGVRLQVDRQELHEVGDEAPAEARFGLVPVADDLAVPHRLPDDPAIRIRRTR